MSRSSKVAELGSKAKPTHTLSWDPKGPTRVLEGHQKHLEELFSSDWRLHLQSVRPAGLQGGLRLCISTLFRGASIKPPPEYSLRGSGAALGRHLLPEAEPKSCPSCYTLRLKPWLCSLPPQGLRPWGLQRTSVLKARQGTAAPREEPPYLSPGGSQASQAVFLAGLDAAHSMEI